MSDSAEGVVKALENIRADVPREAIYDGDEEIKCGANVPPYKGCEKVECNGCGKMVWEHMCYRNSCHYCK